MNTPSSLPTSRPRFPRWPLILLSLGLVLLSAWRSAGPAADSRATWLASWRATNTLWRGVHVGAHSDAQLDQLRGQLPKLAADGVNALILEVNYNFDFQSHPELRPAQYITKARAGEFTQAAHAQGIRVIPQLNCLGHQSWSNSTGILLTKYPQFDETPGQYPDNRGIYCRSWCPQNPDVNRVVFALIDELIDGFQADAFHVGMDEVFIVGSQYCPLCKGGDPAKLFAKAVNDLHEHIVGGRKIEMLMWGDRLFDSRTMGYSRYEGAANGTQGAIDLIPKDIIVCDWHYRRSANYPSVPLLLEKGFRVWPSGWQPQDATEAFSAFSLKQNNPRRVGYLCTTWGKVPLSAVGDWPPITDVLKDWK